MTCVSPEKTYITVSSVRLALPCLHALPWLHEWKSLRFVQISLIKNHKVFFNSYARITHKARNEKSREKINRSQYISHCSITYEAKARSVNLRQSEISPQNPTRAVFSEKFARDFSAPTNQRVSCCVCCVAVTSTWLIHVAFGLFFIHCTICPVVLWLSG